MTQLQTEIRKRTQDLVDLEDEFGAHNYRPLDVVIERAEACGSMT